MQTSVMEAVSVGSTYMKRTVSLLEGSILLKHIPIAVVITTSFILWLLLIMLAYIYLKRRATQKLLEAAGLPTVFWTPRFWTNDYHNPTAKDSTTQQQQQEQILKSTSITRMLPRMKKLQGPMGMYGTVYGFNTAVVHVAHPAAAKAILTHQSDDSSATPGTGTSKRPAYNHFSNFCGRGVFTADGDDWKAKRVAVLHALMRGEGSLEERVLDQAHVAANELVASIDCHNTQQKTSANKASCNVVPLIQQATIGLIFRYITHQDIPANVKTADATHDDIDNKDAVNDNADTSLPSSSPTISSSSSSLLHRYLESVTNIRMIILARSRSVWFLLPRWCYNVFASLCQQEEDTMVAIRQFAHLACHMAQPGSPLKRLQGGTSHVNGKRMDPPSLPPSSFSFKVEPESVSQDLLEEAITLLFAGQDTSAATLSWTLHLLSLHPGIQRKLNQEVRSVLGNVDDSNSKGVRVTRAMIGKMSYLDAVIKESMRLYPVAPFVVRKLTQDIDIPNTAAAATGSHKSGSKANKNATSVTLPRDVMACLWIYGLHHHPDYWSQPEDFVPERWLVAEKEKKDLGISNGAYMPFAVGPRNCLGQPLAQWVLRSLLARLVYQYDFQDEREVDHQKLSSDDNDNNDDDDDTTTVIDRTQWRQDMQAGFTVLPQGGVQLVATDAKPSITTSCN